ncbi:CHAP domain-containing protein [Nonomuraea sp. NPDC050310]|uniref:CHAP domain-containing protein n=1 Tax=Nonomuraea sp. NPDC050310 TaxID=3154935 RepID=UPI0034061731
MQKYIELLESELGYAEKAGAYTKFGDWYGKNVEFDADYTSAPWCDMYLSWAAHKLGYEEWIGQFAWTVAHAEWFKEQGAWGSKPKPGAFVFYDWSGSDEIDNIDHVGIVTRVEGGRIHTIEGNIDGGVAKRKERATDKVVGYGYPEKIKARLDAEAAPQQQEGTLPPDTVLDQQGLTNDLTARIPRVNQAPESAEPAADPAPVTAAAPKAAPSAGPSAAAPASGTSTGSSGAPVSAGAKKGKHAKPGSAETVAPAQEAITQPLPAVVDAAAHTPVMPTLDSPALVGTAVVAALAVLAVAKTRQMRLRLAAAGPLAPETPVRGRRRRKPATARRAVPELATTIPAELATTDPATLSAGDLAALTATDLTPADLTPADLAGAGAVASGGPAVELSAADRALLDTAGTPDISTLETPVLADLAPLDLSRLRAPVFSAPVPEDVADDGADDGAAPGETTATFDAFGAASGRGTSFRRLDADDLAPVLPRSEEAASAYRGRRRKRADHPAEERAPFQASVPPRGRRHRLLDHVPDTTTPRDSRHPQHPHDSRRAERAERAGADGFRQDAPLRGRRHRALSPSS